MNDEARKKMAHAIVVSIGEKKPEAEEAESDAPDAGLVAAMDDLLAAVEAKDSTAMAQAWRNACDLS